MRIKQLLIIALGIVLVTSCGKDDDDNSVAPIVATCSDGVQNQGETGVDCGGPCTACVSVPVSGQICAMVDGVQFASSSAIGSLNGTTLSIIGSKLNGENITIMLTPTFAVGTVPLTSGRYFSFTTSPDITFLSGTCQFGKFDVVNKLLTGSFSFSYRENISNNIVNVTAGKFIDVRYN